MPIREWPIHRGKKNNLTEIIPEELQILELLVKDVKSAVLHMFNELKETMDKKKLKEIKKIMYEQDENMNKEIEII